jgi:hypothetical protein
MKLVYLLLTSSWLPPLSAPLPPLEDPGQEIASAPVCAITGSGATVLAWEQKQGLERRVIVRRREPGKDGAWSGPATIDTGTGVLSLEPRLAGEGSHVFSAWQETAPDFPVEAYLRRSTDEGKSWSSTPVRLPAPREGTAAASMVSIAAHANGVVLAAWEDLRLGIRDIFVRRSTDFGTSWESFDTRLDVNGSGGPAPSYHPQIVFSENEKNAHVVWWDEAAGLADVQVRSSAHGGATWKQPVRLDPGKPGEYASRDVAITARGEILAVAWEDEIGGIEREVIARLSTDAGETWLPEVRMGRPRWAGSVEDPHVAIDGEGRAHVIWTVIPAEEEPDRTPSVTRSRRASKPSPALFHAAIDARGRALDPTTVPAAIPRSSLAWIGGTDRVLWMVWVGTAVDAGTIEAASSWDGGRTWRTSGLARAQNPQGIFVPVPSFAAAVDASGSLHLAWVEGRSERERLRFVRLEQPSKSAP